MPNRETVITHLQIIHTWADFARERDLQFFTARHLEDIAQWADDALVLLKEPEAVPPTRRKKVGAYQSLYCTCGSCGAWLLDNQKYCDECGRRVAWDAID